MNRSRFCLLLGFMLLFLFCLSCVSAECVNDSSGTCADTCSVSHVDTSNSNYDSIRVVDTKNVKIKASDSASLSSQEAICRYGGQVYYDLDDDTSGGVADLYVNNTHVLSNNITGNTAVFEWDGHGNNTLDSYPSGVYDMYVDYTCNNVTMRSNHANLTINTMDTSVNVTGYLLGNSSVNVSLSVSDAVDGNVTGGTVSAYYMGSFINSSSVTDGYSSIELPVDYCRLPVDYIYSDGHMYYTDSSFSDTVNVTLPVNGDVTISVTGTSFVFVSDRYMILVNTSVYSGDGSVCRGNMKAYVSDKLVASSSNTTSILLPVECNMEDVMFEYANTTFNTSIYTPPLSSNIYVPYLYGYKSSGCNMYITITGDGIVNDGVVDIYIDGNLIRSFNPLESAGYYSSSSNETILGYYLDLNSYPTGMYNVSVVYYGSNVFATSTYETTLSVRMINTYIYAYNRSIYRGGVTSLYCYIYSNTRVNVTGGTVTYSIDKTVTRKCNVDNGTSSIDYNVPLNMTLGKHELDIYYSGNDLFNSSNRTVILTVTRSSTTTSIRSWTVNSNEEILLNVSVRSWNKTINNEKIVTIIDSKKIESDILDNSSLVVLPASITPGNTYNLLIKYNGSDILAPSIFNSSYRFDKKNTTIRTYIYLRRNSTLTVTSYIYGDNYARINTGKTLVYINNKLVTTGKVTDNRATHTYNMYNYTSGNYTIKVVYNGSVLYNTSTNTSTVTKTEYHTKTYMTTSTRSYYTQKAKTIKLNLKLTAYNTNITGDIPATLILLDKKNKTIDTKNDLVFHEGVLNYTYLVPQIANNAYTLKIQSHNTTCYRESNTTITLNIGGQYTSLYQKRLWGYKNGNITFNTTLLDANKTVAITNTTINMKIYNTNKTLVDTITLNMTNGKLEYTYKLPDRLTDDKYSVNLTTTENNDYQSSTKTVDLTLNNRRVYIQAGNTNTYTGQNILLNATILDQTTRKQITENGTVTIKINNKTVTTTRIHNGKINYIYRQTLKPGKYNITYTYNGIKIYNNQTKTTTITINKNTPRIQTKNINTKTGKPITIQANITDYHGKYIKTPLKIQIKLNNKTVQDNITVQNGKLEYTYTPKTLNTDNKLTITIHENGLYNTKTVNTNIHLKT